jgi:hypothetical protein
MKKILLVIILFSTAFLNRLQAQCTPDPANITLITPDTVTNFVAGTVGIPYVQIILVHPPTDTTANVGGTLYPVTLDSIVLLNVYNLPPGLTYACNPSNCTFLGGTSGCIAITGTPTTAGLYPLEVRIMTYGKLGGFVAVSQADTIQSYRILINVNASVNSLSQNSNFEIIKSGPNPAGENFSFSVNAPAKMNADFEIFNIIGKKVFTENISLKPGENSISHSTKTLASGVYIFTLKNESRTLTGRFVVGSK